MKNIFLYLSTLIPMIAFSQSGSLQEIRNIYSDYNSDRIQRIEEYSQAEGVPIIFTTNDGTTVCLYDIINGIPKYLKTDNRGARATTGVDEIGVNGDLGLDLDGKGVRIAIWDGGRVRPTHQEFNGRVAQLDGSTSDNFHATHVAGTILGAGINESATGMATNATAITFDFNDDYSEMLERVKDDQSGIILSNHSYGTITGWNISNGTWRWYGDSDVSDQEDYLFGFYNQRARQWDDISYNSPYYTIVKSSGNDRTDSGDGSHPPDGPYDIVSTAGTAKNIMTIGAVNKLQNYTQPSDVVISSFSSWGPTDDGRIKPDFVAAGVNLFSSFETSDNAYGSLSGTSMSAPNATGTLVLVQQLYKKLNGGNYLKSAGLKALIAHTAYEAGISDGPDYIFGWGLINGSKASSFLIESTSENKVIKELKLNNEETYTYEFTPDAGSKVTATICWTDLPGKVPAISLDPTDLILVNDLDMRIHSESENQLPWILDPLKPSKAAIKGNNFRDNIEKIEFISSGETYTLEVSHKGILSEGQDFHLVLSYEDDDEEVLYWTGGDGSLDDPMNWSNVSGGESAGVVPSLESTIVFDNNSFEEFGNILTLQSDFFAKNIVYLSDSEIQIDLGLNDFYIGGNLVLNENFMLKGSGSVIFDTNEHVTIDAANSFNEVDVIFDNEKGNWSFVDELSVKSLILESGSLSFIDTEARFQDFVSKSSKNKKILLNQCEITIGSNFELDNNTVLEENGSMFIFESGSSLIGSGNSISGSIESLGDMVLSGLDTIHELNNSGKLELESSTYIKALNLTSSSSITLNDNQTIEIGQLSFNSESGKEISISSLGNSFIVMDEHVKICLDYFIIENVNLSGRAVVSTGLNSVITNSEGWITKACEDVLFANFNAEFLCKNSLVYFNDLSSGPIEEYNWSFNEFENSNLSDPKFIFESEGLFTVELTVNNGDDFHSFSKEIVISGNELKENEIFANSSSFFSLNSGDSYQWFLNDEIIDGATDREYHHNNKEGKYYVAVFKNGCNSVSSTFELIVSGLQQDDLIDVYPNPTDGLINIKNNSFENEVRLSISDLAGKSQMKVENVENKIDISKLPSGIYLLEIYLNDELYLSKKILLKK